ncbi:MAG: pyrrolysine--tRNA(Pyl) ligase large subunit [Peptostreptococcaceae bacterium]|nr:pyrrolysine--tRNA(Pyl) ligase large subunit [Peptostreptococcaceae bacterium]
MEHFTVTQIERLKQLNCDNDILELEFSDNEDRNIKFREIEISSVKKGKENIKNLLNNKHITISDEVGNKLSKWLMTKDYTKVLTPTIISKDQLKAMTIDEENHLFSQVFWIDKNKCLRPMLAPNLYVVMRELRRITKEPVKIFEIGSCFRKESQGAKHMNEFTMLNMVEIASVEDGKQLDTLKALAHGAMEALGVKNYELVVEKSAVYGSTIDIEINGIEVASGSYGPHDLDANWDVFDTWVGIGFGIERLAMAMEGSATIKKYGRSINFIDGETMKL